MSKRRKSMRLKGESRNAVELSDPSNSVPGRWWRSTAPFPVLAGTLCAMAIMFNICTVSQGWQEMENVDGSINILSQPTWCVSFHSFLFSRGLTVSKYFRMVALKAVSLALAAISYIVLILTMMCKRNPQIGFTVTILGWLAAGALLFSLIGVTLRQHPIVQPRDSLKYTQGYFYGIIAASLYIFIAVLLSAYTATVRLVSLSRQDRRTVEYTSIILRTITFITVLTGGAGVYSAIEGWSFMDALYFTDYTVLTIGIGNIVPKTHLGRSLLFPYATVGIITLGLVVNSIRSFGKSLRRMKLRLELQEARSELLKGKNSTRPAHDEHRDSITLSSILSTATLPQTSDVAELQRIRSDFNRRVQVKALLFFVLAWFVLWLLSAAVFRRSERSEGWTYFIALYFTYTSLTTIGYGDFYPTSNFGKVFFVFWSLLAIPVLTNLVTAMGDIGVRTAVYFAGYILTLGKSRIKRRSGSDPGSRSNCRDIEKNAELSSKLSKRSMDLSTIGTTTTFPANDLQLSQSVHETGQYVLLLAEEISKLVTALMDGDSEQDPRRDWPWVLSLLHSRDGEAGSSVVPVYPEIMNHTTLRASEGFISEEKAAMERKNETLLMLKLLTERLCADLRKTEASAP
ncbi:putative potassium channel [Aspergillus nomiae NRRL 13137]|uniref:Putative potassium channel n=1 Tax=Aspergillus nomiae NRRL (strain ATCC 15546 / NRRL 13137 / CBS 260.88 / M93) TaxID=1509407 RepID=A0A0L1J848_ASPN3|nr:putative potassium channel [Aspergillus nomiae NRRL 13137]KNG87588.1 putative potassium channel [Aspergillus nomiae NRRL 13137]